MYKNLLSCDLFTLSLSLSLSPLFQQIFSFAFIWDGEREAALILSLVQFPCSRVSPTSVAYAEPLQFQMATSFCYLSSLS